MTREHLPLKIGLRLDVLDNEGIWNTGVIVDVAQDDDKDDELVEIKYDGWGDEYNEWVAVSAQRLAPLHMFTIVKKCWAKLTKWPWWPAFVVLRAPTKRGAIESLNAETKVFVEFFDSFDEDKRSRCWMQRKSVVSFDDNFEERAAKNVGKSFHKFVAATQRAAASDSPLLFVDNGTLPIEYSSKSPLSFAAQRQKLGAVAWHDAYATFSDRYRELYGLDVAASSRDGDGAAADATAVADDDTEVVGATVYADEESDENNDAAEDDASSGEDDDVDDEEAADSKRGRRSARVAAPRKRTLPARASTRRNASKRVKAIDLLLQSSHPSLRTSVVATAKHLRRAASADGTASLPTGKREPSTSAAAATAALVTRPLDRDVIDATSTRASAAEVSMTVPTPAPIATDDSSLAKWEPGPDCPIYIIRRDGELSARPNASALRRVTDTIAMDAKPLAASPLVPTSQHRRKLRRTPLVGLDMIGAATTASPTVKVETTRGGGKHAVVIDASNDDDPDATAAIDVQCWSGGSRYNVEDEPWGIQRWLLYGLKQKVGQI